MTSSPVVLSDAVAAALADGRPVVALESTIISHGMPYPTNIEMANEVEQIVRANGAVPATVAVLGGVARVGLDHDQLELLATDEHVHKATTRDLPWLTLTPAFSAQGDRLDDDTVDRLVAGKPTGTAWYLCGPAGLIAIVQRKLNQVPGALVHHEQYEWRAQRRPQAERDQWTSTASTPLGS